MQHCITVDPKKEWKKGVLGFAVSIWGIIVALAGELGLPTLVWWLSDIRLAFATAAWGAVLVVWILVVRHYSLQRLESDSSLHNFFHSSRDAVNKIMASASTDYKTQLDAFHKETAQHLAKFYRDRRGDKDVNCAIRLAQSNDDAEEYATVARSDGMESIRSQRSVPIPSNKGLALAMFEQKQAGVFLIKDIEVEKNETLWFKSDNDDLSDVRALMAAPINGFEDGKKVMIGILYVTAAAKDKFEPGDTLSLKAFADYLGLIYPIILGRAATSNGN